MTLRKPVWISYPRSTCGVLALGGPAAAKEKLLSVNKPKINKKECIMSRTLAKLVRFWGEPLLSQKVD